MKYKFEYRELTFCEDVMRYATRYYKKYERLYNKKYSGDQLKDKAQLHCIYKYTLSLAEQTKKERGCFKKDIHRNLLLIGKKIPNNYDYFCVVLKQMQKDSIEEVLCHEAKGSPKFGARRYDPILYDYAETLYSEGLKTYRQIEEEVSEKAKSLNIQPLSIHVIKKYFARWDVQVRLRPLRNGREWYEANTAKQLHFSKPLFAGQLLEIDGSRLQIPFNNTIKKKIDFLTLFVILDTTTLMVLGYAHGSFESSKVVINAFRRFFENHSFLPFQITRDDGSPYKKDFKPIEELMSRRGVHWMVTHNPRGKATVESFHKTFARSICSYHDFYIGLGITSKHIDSRITSKIKLKKKVGDRKKLGTYQELVLDIDFLINEYNHKVFDLKESAAQKFERLFNDKEIITLSKADKIALTCNLKDEAVLNSEFNIQVGGKKYFYQLDGEEGEITKKVRVAYDPDDLSEVYIFDDNLNFKNSLKPSEIIPSLSRDRTSSQQKIYVRELAARSNRYKRLEQDIRDKRRKVEEATSNSLSFEVLKIHSNKEEEIEIQNEFTRSLIAEEMNPEQPEELSRIRNLPNTYVAKVVNSDYEKLDKWKSNG